MSIIHFDGFDFYNSLGPGGRKWDQGSGGSLGFWPGRFGGGQSLATAGSGVGSHITWGCHKTFPAHYSTWIVGYAAKWDTFSLDDPFMLFTDGSTVQCSLWVDPSSNVIQLRTGRGQSISDTVLASTGFVPPLTLLFYLECKIVIGNPGSVEIRVNGQTEVSASGIQTQQSGNATVNQINITATHPYGNDWYCDDFYLLDPTDGVGSVDFLGEVRIQTKYPDADGFETDFLPSQGIVNANNVNAAVTNYTENGKFNYSGTVDAIDLYSIGNFTISGTIFAVQENLSFRKDDVGNRSVAPMLRTASTNYVGTAAPCYSDYTYTGKIWELNPSTGLPWNLTDLNQAEFGIKVIS